MITGKTNESLGTHEIVFLQFYGYLTRGAVTTSYHVKLHPEHVVTVTTRPPTVEEMSQLGAYGRESMYEVTDILGRIWKVIDMESQLKLQAL